jgi:hypothetical protein
MTYEANNPSEDSNRSPNAHLKGLFHRICKMLFFDIKPGEDDAGIFFTDIHITSICF